jgi:hypothetical protein
MIPQGDLIERDGITLAPCFNSYWQLSYTDQLSDKVLYSPGVSIETSGI